MNKIKNVGYLFALLGMAIFAGSLLNESPLWVDRIRDGGIILFALGMAAFLSALFYSLGMDTEQERIHKNQILKALNETPASTLLAYSAEEDRSSSS